MSVFLTRHQRLYRQLRAVPGGKPWPAFALTSREATSKESPAGSGYSGVCWGKSGRESFSPFGTSHHCSPVWILWCLLHGCAPWQPSYPPGHLLSHAHGCGTGRKKELQPDTRNPWARTVLACPHRLDPSLHPHPPPGHHSMCCPTFPQHRDHLRVLGGPTCLSCHFHLALHGHRDALYVSLILKYHLLHPESN